MVFYSTPRPRTRYRAGAMVVLLVLVAHPSLSADGDSKSDDLCFKPSTDGFISAWLQLGAISAPKHLKKHSKRLADWDPLGIPSLKEPPKEGDMAAGRRFKVRYKGSNHLWFRGRRPAVTYLAAVLRTAGEQQIWLSYGCDGSNEVWLNGQRLSSRDLKRRAVKDTDLTALNLKPGDNLLVLKLWKSDPLAWRLYARLLDADFTPAENVHVVLPGAAEHFQDALESTRRLVIGRKVDLNAQSVKVTGRIVFPGGRPLGEKTGYKITFAGPNSPKEIEGTQDLSLEGPADVALFTFDFAGDDSPLSTRIGIGPLSLRGNLNFRMSDVQGLHRAVASLAIARKRDDLKRTSLESAAWRIDHLTALIENGDRDYPYLTREIKDTEAITKALAEGRDPYWERRGEVQRRGYLSKLDGSYNYYALYVPPGWREEGEKQYGLVVSLHGINGSPMKNMLTIFGKRLLEGEDKLARERHPKRIGRSRFFVLSPSGFGNSGYRAFGEVDVLDAIEQVRERYRIDPNRVYVTGFSMGGIGSASIPLRKPDLFAAAAPLCGYHSLFIYRSLARATLKPWETFLASFRSNKDWALNGKYLPLHVVHGLKDNPRHSSSLVDQYQKLKYKVTYVTPDEGHNIWDETYKDRWIFNHFARLKRKTSPKRIAFKTSRLRYRSSHWIRIDDAADYGKWSRIDAAWNKTNEIAVKTDNVDAFAVQNDAMLSGKNPVVLLVDGEKFDGKKDVDSWPFHRQGDHWEKGPKPSCRGLCKRPGLAGPIGDAYYEPLLFVFGSGCPSEAILARRLIKELKEPWQGVTVNWPVKADVDVTKEDIKNYSLVLVGTKTCHSIISQMEDRLPIRVRDKSVTMGDAEFKGQTVAATFIYPNPLNPDRYVLMHTGVSKEALYYTAHLPKLVPDYVIFDGSTWGIKGGRVLGDQRNVLAAGFFDKTWGFSPDNK